MSPASNRRSSPLEALRRLEARGGWDEADLNDFAIVDSSPTPLAGHRFNNDLRYRESDDPGQWHLTPSHVLAHVIQDLGGIQTDPCTFSDNPTGADHWYTAEYDGLTQEWHGSTFCNPPYGKAREPWIRRCIEHAEKLHRVILLVPAATDTRIFQQAAVTSTALVFVCARLQFGTLRENRRQHAASHPSVLIGWNTELESCSSLGLRVRP